MAMSRKVIQKDTASKQNQTYNDLVNKVLDETPMTLVIDEYGELVEIITPWSRKDMRLHREGNV